MDGLLLVDKPSGWTSHDAVAYIRKTLGQKKAGHTGTLDPDATGLLIILLGKATRLAPYFEADEKEYVAWMKLGEETDTQDASGEVIKRCPVPPLDEKNIQEVFGRFTGVLEQVPPMYSAIKVGGQPLYKKARAGTEVERPPRRIEVRELELLGLEPPAVGFRVLCSKGTYVRTLCRDMGEALGSCAHMTSLRRTRAGGYGIEGATDLSGRPSKEGLAVHIVPLDGMLPAMPGVVVSDIGASGISFGRSPGKAEISEMPDRLEEGRAVRVTDCSGRLLAIGETAGAGEAVPVRLKAVLV